MKPNYLMCHECLHEFHKTDSDFKTAKLSLEISGGNGCHICDQKLLDIIVKSIFA